MKLFYKLKGAKKEAPMASSTVEVIKGNNHIDLGNVKDKNLASSKNTFFDSLFKTKTSKLGKSKVISNIKDRDSTHIGSETSVDIFHS